MNHLKNNVFCGTAQILEKDVFNAGDTDFGNTFYSIQLSKFKAVLPKLVCYLNTDEIKRSERYFHTKDKERFIICRALLKYCISKHLRLEIGNVVFKKGANKKPYLLNNDALFFNVTHAGDYAVIGISSAPIGIDIEYVNTDFDYNEIIRAVFNNKELEVLSTSKNKRHTFYKLWTRKEAIVKATGFGITDDFIDIPALDGGHTMSKKLLGQLKHLQVVSFQFRGYKGAIALSQNDQPKTIIFNNLFLKSNEF